MAIPSRKPNEVNIPSRKRKEIFQSLLLPLMLPFKSKFNVKSAFLRELGSRFYAKKVFFLVFGSFLPSFFEQEGTFLVFDFDLVGFFLYYALV